ncbi:helix-turn-helix domain-containing protein [Micromonospora sp. SH-82]|uniref:helix-turn-helix domain-containing protein n=1 Tax=Micromonospora sp. SH-82 TaxID=3132938 RepID=UPI003EB77703
MLEQPVFGQRLRALRVKQGLSQAALAGDGMSTGYLSRLESGARRPTTRVVTHLAERLGVPTSEFEAPANGETGHPAVQTSSLAHLLAAVISGTPDDELGETLAEALRTGDRWDAALRWQALWLLAQLRDGQGRHEEEHALLTELTQLSDELGTPALRARARTQLSRCARLLGDNAAAREHALQASRVTDDLSVADRAGVLHALVSAEAELGLLVEARTHADELSALTAPTGGPLRVEALWAAATVRIRQGDHTGAQEVLEQALQSLDSRQDLTLWVRLRLAAASLYLQITPALTDRAQVYLDEVAPALDLVGTELHHQQLLTLRAHLAFEQGRLEDARAVCEQMDEQALLLSFRDRIRFRALCGRLSILGGDRDGGIQTLQQLAEQAQEARNAELAAEIWRTLAETLAQGYEPVEAKSPRRTATRSRR